LLSTKVDNDGVLEANKRREECRLSVHSLRKSYGTNLADLGTPVHTLKELMGHSNIETAMRFYIKNNAENSRKAAERLEGLMRE
jgi:integrase